MLIKALGWYIEQGVHCTYKTICVGLLIAGSTLLIQATTELGYNYINVSFHVDLMYLLNSQHT